MNTSDNYKNILSVTSVKKYTPPKYPTQSEANLAPKLLRKLPSHWQKNAAVVAAAGLFSAMTLTSCGILNPRNNKTGYNPDSESYINVAPVFMHGEGTGSMGCVMVAPPVFLSEQEALAIIKNAAENEGLKFETDAPEYTATQNKPHQTSNYSWEQKKYVLGDGNVGLDLYDDKKGVAISYIAMESAEQTYPDGPWSSITGYYPRELAELTVEDFSQQKGDITAGVFYDPGTDWTTVESVINEYHEKTSEIYDKYYDEQNPEIYQEKYEEAFAEYEASIKSFLEEDLRAQVRDFIEWLQAQGII